MKNYRNAEFKLTKQYYRSLSLAEKEKLKKEYIKEFEDLLDEEELKENLKEIFEDN